MGENNILFICSGKNPFEALISFSWISHLSSSSLLLPYHHLKAPNFRVSIKFKQICDKCSRKWTCKIILLHNTAPISFVLMHFHKIYNLCSGLGVRVLSHWGQTNQISHEILFSINNIQNHKFAVYLLQKQNRFLKSTQTKYLH